MWFFFKVCFSSSSINSRFLTTCFFTPPALSYRVAILHVPAKWTFHTLIQTHIHSLSYTKYKLFSPICEHLHLTHSLPQGLLMPLSSLLPFLSPTGSGSHPEWWQPLFQLSHMYVRCCVAGFGKGQLLCFLLLFSQLDVFYLFTPYVCSIS